MKQERTNKSVTSNILWKFAERFLAQIVSFVVSLVLARLLLPEDYGVVSIVLIFINIANAFVTSGIPTALIQKKKPDQLDFSTCFYFNIVFSAGLYLILFFIAPVIANFYENPDLTLVLRVFGIRIIVAGINSVQHSIISKQLNFKKFFLATLFGTVVSGVVGILMAIKGFGVWALVAQYLINTTIDTIVLIFTLKWKPSLMFSFKRLGSLFKFGWKILFEGVSSVVASQFRNLIIGKVYTSSDLGYYTKAQQFPRLIMDNINESVRSVMFPVMSSLQDERERLVFFLRKSIRISSYILFPMLFGLAAISNNLIVVLLTDKWAQSIPYLYIFCFTYLISVGLYPRHEALKSIGRSDVFMIEHIFARLLNIGLLLLIYKISVFAIALSGIAGSIMLLITVVITSKIFTSYKITDQIKDVLPLLGLCTAMFVPTFFIGFLPINRMVALIIQVIAGISLYLIFSLIFKPEGYIYVLGLIKKIFFKTKKRDLSSEDNEHSRLFFVFAILVALTVSCFFKFLPLPFEWVFIIQLLSFIITLFIILLCNKNKIGSLLLAYINKTIENFEKDNGKKDVNR